MDHAQAALTQRWLPVLNTESNIIPAHGAMELAGITYDADNGRIVYNVKRPSADNVRNLLFNSWEPIASGGYGAGTMDFPLVAAYTGTAPTAGQAIGSTLDSYLLTACNEGYTSIADITNKAGFVVIKEGMEFEEIDAVVDVYNSGTGLNQIVRKIFIPLPCTGMSEETVEQIIGFYDCNQTVQSAVSGSETPAFAINSYVTKQAGEVTISWSIPTSYWTSNINSQWEWRVQYKNTSGAWIDLAGPSVQTVILFDYGPTDITGSTVTNADVNLWMGTIIDGNHANFPSDYDNTGNQIQVRIKVTDEGLYFAPPGSPIYTADFPISLPTLDPPVDWDGADDCTLYHASDPGIC